MMIISSLFKTNTLSRTH